MDLIHPDEQENAISNPSTYYGRIFFCSGMTEDGYLLLNHADKQYRVKPSLYHLRPTPDFKFGDKVKYKKDPQRIGYVHDMQWHVMKREYFYFLTMDGKKAKKRYYAEDLEMVE